MSLRSVLITGVYGLIGSTTYRTLSAQPDRYDVYGLDRTRTPSERVPKDQVFEIPEERFFLGDLTEMEEVERAVRGKDVVVHLAADPEGRSWESLLQNNIIGAYHVFEACKRAGVKRLIAASTYLVSEGCREREPYRAILEKRYADVPPDFPRITPAVPAEPRSLYAASKVWSESLAQTYHASGMSCLCLRIGGVRPHPGGAVDVWCSPHDIVQLIECCINAPDELRFEIFYGMSNNRWRWVDIEHARLKVGYNPQDRAEDDPE